MTDISTYRLSIGGSWTWMRLRCCVRGGGVVRELIALSDWGPLIGSWPGMKVSRSIARNWKRRLSAMWDDWIRGNSTGRTTGARETVWAVGAAHLYDYRPAPRGSQEDLFV